MPRPLRKAVAVDELGQRDRQLLRIFSSATTKKLEARLNKVDDLPRYQRVEIRDFMDQYFAERALVASMASRS